MLAPKIHLVREEAEMPYTKAMFAIAILNVSFGLMMVIAPDVSIALMSPDEVSESSTTSPTLVSSVEAMNRLLGSFIVTLGVMAYVLQEVREPSLRARILKVSAIATVLIILCSTPKELGWPPLTVSLISIGIFLLALYQLDTDAPPQEATEKGEPSVASTSGEPDLEASAPAADDSKGT